MFNKMISNDLDGKDKMVSKFSNTSMLNKASYNMKELRETMGATMLRQQ